MRLNSTCMYELLSFESWFRGLLVKKWRGTSAQEYLALNQALNSYDQRRLKKTRVWNLSKRETEYIYWFIAIINLTYVFNLKTMLPNRKVLIVVLLVYHTRTKTPLWRPYYDRYPLTITDRARYYRLAYVIQRYALSVILISFCVYLTSVPGYHNHLCNSVTLSP